ncbi:MAG: hypothetical protein LBT69_00235 [Lactobacillales bacterium]|nr:hypothetical protein [Lactobacillales bacterium]
MKIFSVRSIVFLSMMTAISVVLRQAFLGIPNFQLMTAFFFVMIVFWGIPNSLFVMTLSLIITGFFNGFGPWIGAQIIDYALFMLLWSILQKRFKNLWLQSVITGGLSFFYGLLISFLTAPFFSVTNFWVFYFQGVHFDCIHAAATMIGYPILFKVFERISEMNTKYNNAI